MAGKAHRPKPRRGDEDQERTAGDILEDVRTAAEIQAALLAIAPSTGLRVDVDAEEGTVYLRGEVASREQKVEAERVVQGMRIRGVKRIRNRLVVNPLVPPLPRP